MNSPKRMLVPLLAAICTGGLISCAGSAKPTATEKMMGNGLAPPPGQALICIYRKPRFSPTTSSIGTNAWIDGKYAGKNRGGTFLVVPVKPGKHVVQLMFLQNEGVNTHPVNTTAGKTYFFRQVMEAKVDKIVFIPTPAPLPRLEGKSFPVSEAEGRADVATCKLIGTTSAP